MKPPPAPAASSSEPQSGRRSALAIDMDAFIPAALTNLAQKITSTASATYRPRFGVGITDWRISPCSPASPGSRRSGSARRPDLTRRPSAGACETLRRQGSSKCAAGEPNRRRLPVALTANGLAAHDRIVIVALERQERLLKGFSSDERAQLRAFIARMRREVETIKTSV